MPHAWPGVLFIRRMRVVAGVLVLLEQAADVAGFDRKKKTFP